MDTNTPIDIDMNQVVTVTKIVQRFLTPNGGLPVVLIPLGENQRPIPDKVGYACTTQDEFVSALRAIYTLSPCHMARLVPAQRSAA
jgi:hypothetical protein